MAIDEEDQEELVKAAALFEQRRRTTNKGKSQDAKFAAISSYGTQQLADAVETGEALTNAEVKNT